MAKRRWTVVFVPHGSEPSKIVEVSYGVIKMAARRRGAGRRRRCWWAMPRWPGPPTSRGRPGCRQENARLAQEIGELHGRLATLADTLTRISQRDAGSGCSPTSSRSIPRSRPPASAAPLAPRPVLPDAGPAARRSQEIRVDLNALIRRANLLASSFEEAKDSLASHSQRLAATPSIMPTQGWLTSAFSSMREHPILHIARPHEGIDVTAPMGSPIEAPAAGVVTEPAGSRATATRSPSTTATGSSPSSPTPRSCWSGPASGSLAASASRWWATPASPPARTCTTRCT